MPLNVRVLASTRVILCCFVCWTTAILIIVGVARPAWHVAQGFLPFLAAIFIGGPLVFIAIRLDLLALIQDKIDAVREARRQPQEEEVRTTRIKESYGLRTGILGLKNPTAEYLTFEAGADETAYEVPREFAPPIPAPTYPHKDDAITATRAEARTEYPACMGSGKDSRKTEFNLSNLANEKGSAGPAYDVPREFAPPVLPIKSQHKTNPVASTSTVRPEASSGPGACKGTKEENRPTEFHFRPVFEGPLTKENKEKPRETVEQSLACQSSVAFDGHRIAFDGHRVKILIETKPAAETGLPKVPIDSGATAEQTPKG
ncbi:uncharacterized protein LOC108665342 [Hyalella azteca]|uniref:Uncharacterized protein LOC108665342 n=1 Tax=Hyalella azteca TaxID=294128 RepID=A0A8B7N166_HYAAZ|nr:uncharacterized protein LOC108665342 [Hyalella azteca]